VISHQKLFWWFLYIKITVIKASFVDIFSWVFPSFYKSILRLGTFHTNHCVATSEKKSINLASVTAIFDKKRGKLSSVTVNSFFFSRRNCSQSQVKLKIKKTKKKKAIGNLYFQVKWFYLFVPANVKRRGQNVSRTFPRK
jgi:hypothetical protein